MKSVDWLCDDWRYECVEVEKNEFSIIVIIVLNCWDFPARSVWWVAKWVRRRIARYLTNQMRLFSSFYCGALWRRLRKTSIYGVKEYVVLLTGLCVTVTWMNISLLLLHSINNRYLWYKVLGLCSQKVMVEYRKTCAEEKNTESKNTKKLDIFQLERVNGGFWCPVVIIWLDMIAVLN